MERSAMTEFLELTAKIARREYLPSLEKCRTIRDARAEVQRYDDYHGYLAQKLKEIWDRLEREVTNERS